MIQKIELFQREKIDSNKLFEIYQGWQAYAKWANSYKLKNKIINEIKRS